MLAKRVASRQLAALHMSARRLSLNENDRNRDDLDKVYAAHKDEQLQHTREGKARWRQELASSSESAVKADRGETDKDAVFLEMQKRQKTQKTQRMQGEADSRQ